METEQTPNYEEISKDEASTFPEPTYQYSEEEKVMKETENNYKYSSTKKTVGKYNFSFVSISPKYVQIYLFLNVQDYNNC